MSSVDLSLDIPLPEADRPSAEVIGAESDEIVRRFLAQRASKPGRGHYTVLLPHDVSVWGIARARERLALRRWASTVVWSAPLMLRVFPRPQIDEAV